TREYMIRLQGTSKVVNFGLFRKYKSAITQSLALRMSARIPTLRQLLSGDELPSAVISAAPKVFPSRIHYRKPHLQLARMKSRFMRAITSSLISLGQTASHSPMLVQPPKSSRAA